MTTSGNEIIKWEGKPKQGLVFTKQDIFLIPFSLLWCGFAIFWESTANNGKAPMFFLFFGAFFVIMGLYFVFGRFIHDIINRTFTFYTITNQRVIIRKYSEIESIPLNINTPIRLVEYSNNTGDIAFGQISEGNILNRKSMKSLRSSEIGVPCFFHVKDAKSLYDSIYEIMKINN